MLFDPPVKRLAKFKGLLRNNPTATIRIPTNAILMECLLMERAPPLIDISMPHTPPIVNNKPQVWRRAPAAFNGDRLELIRYLKLLPK